MTRLSLSRVRQLFRRPRPAFTMVELVVTVAIVGLLCGVVIDAGQREWRRQQRSTVVLELAGWLESVRRSAIKGHSCTVTIVGGEYGNGALLATVSTPLAPDGPCGTVGGFRLIGLTRAQGFQVGETGVTTRFTFTPAGTLFRDPDPRTAIVISVRLRDDDLQSQECLRLDGLLGLIEVGVVRGQVCGVGRDR